MTTKREPEGVIFRVGKSRIAAPICAPAGPACHVVNEGCKASPKTLDATRAECFACGNPVCTNPACSRRIRWHRWGRRRVCASCQEDDARDVP